MLLISELDSFRARSLLNNPTSLKPMVTFSLPRIMKCARYYSHLEAGMVPLQAQMETKAKKECWNLSVIFKIALLIAPTQWLSPITSLQNWSGLANNTKHEPDLNKKPVRTAFQTIALCASHVFVLAGHSCLDFDTETFLDKAESRLAYSSVGSAYAWPSSLYYLAFRQANLNSPCFFQGKWGNPIL